MEQVNEKEKDDVFIYYDEKTKQFTKSIMSSNLGIKPMSFRLARKKVSNLNKHLVEAFDNTSNNKDIIVIKCKECDDYFIMPYNHAKWYYGKDYKLPRRCEACRKNNNRV